MRTGLTDEGPVIRAVVSPTYEAVKDSTIASSLLRTLGDLKVQRSGVTEMSTSFVVEVGEPLKKGGIVGTLHGGLLVRNSDVGYASLAVLAHLTRLICSNGMVAPVGEGEIVRARHRFVDVLKIEAQIVQGIAKLPEGLIRAANILSASTERRIEGKVEDEIHEVLREAHLLRRHERAVVLAYQREPHASAFGISQAMTLAAQDATPEDRVALEGAAGAYLAGSA